MDPTSKKEGHCDLIAHTVLLYVLFCLTYMYCTLYVLYILHTAHSTCSLFPCFRCWGFIFNNCSPHSCKLSIFHYSRRPSDSWSWLPRNADDVLRGAATSSLSLECRFRSAATRKLWQPDYLPLVTVVIGHLLRNVKLNNTTLIRCCKKIKMVSV